ncbi:Ig-like domain-containing protein [Psychrosphaera sp. B3R10]|uniref:Ig-like domain-containing protein n=1 Tax=unclassified Psychrosphaera TaxID=2641570 RepID=UPI001C07FC33|nr:MULTISPECIES: Ig-like domain-containing protein [unclassified Psychrosphaera]MBU2881769.1 Ig-like domain-containing protein [Psychrosphaera sp. I2R16]MBU2990146.1 Ig-like domain-containing protein [Psychrosphaera sp. B3R10]
MNKLFKQALLSAMISTAVASCGVDEGLDYNFSSSKPVTFDEAPFSKSYPELSGVVEIDLLEGAMVDGKALSVDSYPSPIFIREFQFAAVNTAFNTPQGEGNQGNNNVSPFTMSEDGTKLVLDTDAFDQALRMCDETDVRGGTNDDGTPAPDGLRDFPTSITYNISYIVDVGHELAPGEEVDRRTLSLTVNAISDPVTSVQAFDLSLASGAVEPMLSATSPAYACNSNLTYSIADTSVATVDADGNVTAANQGETVITVTSEEDSSLSAQATITVTPGFNLEIVNQDYNELGAPLGTKTVPTCTSIGAEVKPSIVNDTLSGVYSYDWSASDLTTEFAMSESDGEFGATGRYTNTLAVGESSTLTVGLDSGYTGATSANDVAEQNITVTAESNLACDPGEPVDSNWIIDFKLDGNVGPNWWGGTTVSADALSGNAIEISGGQNIDPANGAGRLIVQGAWNNDKNWYTQRFGRPDTSTGKKYKFTVWAKLSDVPADDIELSHVSINWNYPAGITGPGYDRRLPSAGIQSAVLKRTTDWQLVELIDKLSGTPVWTVPAEWDANAPVFPGFKVTGLPEGQTLLIDELSIVEVN